MPEFSNRLIHETSPYLLQHAHNPVEWFPWGEEAFLKAYEEDKPVLVSIGYSACHWCHVMERESFENVEIASKMNELLVCIKVDREERPDIDSIYMNAVQQMHGHGGWPLNVFLLPDGRPFYGGTYFPPSDFRGMPSWPKVIDAVSEAYKTQRNMVEENANVLTNALIAHVSKEHPQESINSTITDNAFQTLLSVFDHENGGFGNAPKFPQSMPQEFLLRYYIRTGDQRAKEMVEVTLSKMAKGGIYDQLGGGFSRYATDDQWLIPHFEKMLYDNALLASLCAQFFTLSGDHQYSILVQEILDYINRNLRHDQGGYFSSQDADSEGVEGKYYVWTLSEIQLILGDDADVYAYHYGVTQNGNFEGANILNIQGSIASSSNVLNLEIENLRRILRDSNQKLLNQRTKRIPPATDDKVLTSWNALILRVFAEAGLSLGRKDYIESAENNAKFLLENLYINNRLLRTWKNGEAHLLGYLEDYAFLINALLSLHASTFSSEWIATAERLTDEMIELFWDDESNRFYDVGVDHEQLITRPYTVFDNAIPSGSSSAAEALLRMYKITNSKEYFQKSEAILQEVIPLISRYPLGFGNWLKILELYMAKSTELVIVGRPEDLNTQELIQVVSSKFLPFLTLYGINPDENQIFQSPLSEDRANADAPMAYLCNNFTCELPTNDPSQLQELLGL
tara:strand:- start:3621 stop:5669 length:2049 start_codon:yes stop_codon:yes gene_type:complete